MIDTNTLANAAVIAIVGVDRAFSHHRLSRGKRDDTVIKSRLSGIADRLEDVEKGQRKTEMSIDAIFRILANVMQKRGERSIGRAD